MDEHKVRLVAVALVGCPNVHRGLVVVDVDGGKGEAAVAEVNG